MSKADWQVRRDLIELGNDLRTARLAAGLTLAEVGRAVGVVPSMILKIERAGPPAARCDLIAKHAAAVGMRARIKVYPEGEPLRDAAQVEMIRRFRARIVGPHRFAFEVPIADVPGDGRAWDAVLELPGCLCGLEFVTRFHDCQAQLRAFQLKFRDGHMDRMIVIVKATHSNRRALRAAREIVEVSLPLQTRRVLAALAASRDPGGNGLVLI